MAKPTTNPTTPPMRAAKTTKLGVEPWPVDRPKPYEGNPRVISEAAIEKVAASIQRYGWRQPIVVNPKGVILAGHTRLLAAQRLQLAQVPVHVARGLSPEEEAAYRLADNRMNEEAEWDLGKLALELTGLPFDLPTGFDNDELEKILAEELGAGDPDAVPPVDEAGAPISKTGEVYALGNHRLVCGDAMNALHVRLLMGTDLAGMVFTDPPYGVEFQSGMSQGGTATRFDQLENDDTMLNIAPVLLGIMADDTAAFVWTSHQVYPAWRAQFGSAYKQTIIWHKPGGGIGDLTGAYANDYELALFCTKGRPLFRGQRGMAVCRVAKDAAGTYEHPTQKPVALGERAMRDFSDPGATVLDLFGGSGSTLVAAARCGRRARLMEIDPRYCDVIRKRWTRFARDNGKDPGPAALDG